MRETVARPWNFDRRKRSLFTVSMLMRVLNGLHLLARRERFIHRLARLLVCHIAPLCRRELHGL